MKKSILNQCVPFCIGQNCRKTGVGAVGTGGMAQSKGLKETPSTIPRAANVGYGHH